MSDLYCRDAYGRSVLIGLTYEETLEFEALDASSPTAEQALGLKWETDESSFPPDETLWLELYKRHRAACVGINNVQR